VVTIPTTFLNPLSTKRLWPCSWAAVSLSVLASLCK